MSDYLHWHHFVRRRPYWQSISIHTSHVAKRKFTDWSVGLSGSSWYRDPYHLSSARYHTPVPPHLDYGCLICSSANSSKYKTRSKSSSIRYSFFETLCAVWGEQSHCRHVAQNLPCHRIEVIFVPWGQSYCIHEETNKRLNSGNACYLSVQNGSFPVCYPKA